MSEKPRKRLVHFREYAETKVGNGIGYAFATALGCGGSIVLAIAVFSAAVTILFGLFGRSGVDGGPEWDSIIAALVIGGVVSGISIGAMWLAKMLFETFRESTPVELVTKNTARYLPPAETLVRSSDRPASVQQIELLRAATDGPETPSEQLLRATQEYRQDV